MISALEIELFLKSRGELISTSGQPEQTVEKPVPFDQIAQNTLTFIRHVEGEELNKIADIPGIILILPELDPSCDHIAVKAQGYWIQCRDPRLTFALVLCEYFEPRLTHHISPNADIHEMARLGNDVGIDAFAVISAGVHIADGCHIAAHTMLHSGVQLGRGVTIGAGTCLGGPGFGYQRDNDGTPQRFPQLGILEIGDGCEIGENVTINRAALTTTTIEAHVKIDDQTYVAHNVSIGAGTLIMAGVRIMGAAAIGTGVDIHQGSLIGQGVRIGDRAVIGMGSVVLSDIPADTFAAGTPAKRRGPAEKHRLSR